MQSEWEAKNKDMAAHSKIQPEVLVSINGKVIHTITSLSTSDIRLDRVRAAHEYNMGLNVVNIRGISATGTIAFAATPCTVTFSADPRLDSIVSDQED